jgi:hypothetical protein
MKRLLLVAAVMGAGTARAGADVQLDYGVRLVDFHRFTDARGASSGYGTDIGTTLRWRPDKAMWAVGAFFSQQTFDLAQKDAFFDTVRATEAGIDALIALGDKGLSPQMGMSYTVSGRVVGKTTDPLALRNSDGGGVAATGASTWTYTMTGVHLRPGVQWAVGKGGFLTFGVDASLQSAELRTVEVRTVDRSDEMKGVARTNAPFDSYAFMLGARASL